MRVAIIINKLTSAGAERLTVDQITELKRRGFEVELITLAPERPNDSFMPLVDLPDTAKHRFQFDSLVSFPAWSHLIKHLRTSKPDVIITHLWYANTIGRIAGRFAGVPKIISFEHNMYDTVKTKRQFLADRILQSSCAKIIAVSSAVRESLIRHGIHEERIAVIENGIDISRYQQARSAVIDTTDPFVYLFAGRLIPQKGVDVLLRACAKLPSGTLLIAGGGSEHEALTQLCRDLGVAQRVKWLGVRRDIPELLKHANCFVLPSRHEGMPMVLIEAMASGCPVIVSDFASARDVVRDGISGMVVPIGDADALANAMSTIASDPELASRIAAAAMQEVQRFSIKTHIDRLLKILNA